MGLLNVSRAEPMTEVNVLGHDTRDVMATIIEVSQFRQTLCDDGGVLKTDDDLTK